MRKILSIFLFLICAFGASFSLVSCKKEKPAPYAKEYVFDGIDFDKSSSLKIEHLNSFIPSSAVLGTEKITTIKAFEKLIRNNLDRYSIDVHGVGGNERIYFKPKYHSITIMTDATLLLSYQEGDKYASEELSYTLETNDGAWYYVTEKETFSWNGKTTFCYKVAFPIEAPNYFNVVYNYKAK